MRPKFEYSAADSAGPAEHNVQGADNNAFAAQGPPS
jgi:hypothetical protein